MRKLILIGVAAAGMTAAVLMAGCRRHAEIKFDTTYQAVLLDNGSVYFGKLQGAGTRRPVLTEVYYVQSQVNQETKEVKNILIRRGNEWHAPDRMYLNPRHIVLIEPVGPNSKVAQLIAEDKVKR